MCCAGADAEADGYWIIKWIGFHSSDHLIKEADITSNVFKNTQFSERTMAGTKS